MPFTVFTNDSDNHALGIGLDARNKPVCLLLSIDSISEGGEIAIEAEYYVQERGDLRVSCSQGSAILKNVSQMCLDALQARLPLVVIDPKGQREMLIEPLSPSSLDIYREAGR